MPKIIPIKDLKNTSAISELCHETTEPIYITKNGYGDMVIMSIEMFEEYQYLRDVYSKLTVAELEISEGKVQDASASLTSIREKYNV